MTFASYNPLQKLLPIIFSALSHWASLHIALFNRWRSVCVCVCGLQTNKLGNRSAFGETVKNLSRARKVFCFRSDTQVSGDFSSHSCCHYNNQELERASTASVTTPREVKYPKKPLGWKVKDLQLSKTKPSRPSLTSWLAQMLRG